MADLAVPVVRGVVSSPFGLRTDPGTGAPNTMHKGIDIAAPEGEPVLAAADGIIEAINPASVTGGMMMVVLHYDGTRTRYLHMSKILVNKVGLKVFQRQAIGHVGHTGENRAGGSFKDHLHFEYLDKNGVALDPGPMIGLVTVKKGEVVQNVERISPAAVGLLAVAVGIFLLR